MSKKLREKMQHELIAIAKESNVSPQVFLSELGTAFLNICGWICEALKFTEEERNQFFDGLLDALRDSVEDTKNRRAKNGTV